MLHASETQLVGQWLTTGAIVEADAVCKRIESEVAKLVEVASTSDGWSTLYRDTEDGRLWERTFPQSHVHGGGPPSLQVIASAVAEAKYGRVA